jgi:hypothetical protein
VVTISMECPGCGTRLDIELGPDAEMRQTARRDGTAQVWQRGQVLHECDPRV